MAGPESKILLKYMAMNVYLHHILKTIVELYRKYVYFGSLHLECLYSDTGAWQD
jgi:hypothetical protein